MTVLQALETSLNKVKDWSTSAHEDIREEISDLEERLTTLEEKNEDDPGSTGYTNLIPTSIDFSKNPYNGGTGYKEGYRLNSSGIETAATGCVVSGFIPYNGKDIQVRIPNSATTSGNNYLHIYDADFVCLCYAADGTIIDGSLHQFDSWVTKYGATRKIENTTQIITIPANLIYGTTAYIRVSGDVHASLSSDTFVVALGENISDNTGEDEPQTENGIPSYWIPELEEKADAIQAAMETAGRNKSAFLWYTDAHWPTNSKMSPLLLDYLIKNTPMNKVNFGGDIVGDPSPHNHENTKYVYEWREMIADLPNHHSVFGNHDLYHRAANVIDMAYAQLLAPEESSDMVIGGDSYYYIDNVAEKTRYLYLSYITAGAGFTNAEIIEELVEQGEFITQALSSVAEGWHIVVIAHRWYQYTKDASGQLIIEGGSFPFYEAEILRFFDAYNTRATAHKEPNYIVPVDFTDAKGKVEFCIGGHVHLDYDFTTESGIPVIITASDTNYERNTEETEDNGAFGTISESAIFGVVADYNNKAINIIGVGRGTSRVIDTGTDEPDAPATTLLSLDREYVSGPTGESIAAHFDTSKAYLNVYYGDSAFKATSCTASDITENSVTVKESGSGGICVAYPVDLAGQSATQARITFDYAGAGKCRAYYALFNKGGSPAGSPSLFTNETAGTGGSADVTIDLQGYNALVIYLSSNTGNVKTYSNMSLSLI